MTKKIPTTKAYLATITLLLLLLGNLTLAQSTANYSFNTINTGSLVDMSTGTTDIFPTGTYRDDVASSVINIGFDFVFMGTIYSQFSINSNGQMRLGSTAIGGTQQSPTAGVPLIAPISGDNSLQSIGKAHYKVLGTAPNRTLVVEWDKVRIPFTDDIAGTYGTFQVLLNETSGIIEFRYGRMYNMSTSAQSRGVYFSSGTSAGQIGQVINITTTLDYNSSSTSLTTTIFSASSDMTNLNSTTDGNRRVFTFTPPTAPDDPTSLTFTGVGVAGMTLNWTDNATNETGYLVYRSLDGTNYTLVGTLAANTTSYSATGLTPSTLYYWRVYAINEGQLSSALSDSQSTNAPSLSGTKTIGASGDYASLGAAIADVQLQGLAGALVLEFLSDYAGTETFPITLTNLTTTSSNTLTIRPATGVTGISISGSNTTAILRIVNEDYVIIDGRPGGTGTARELTFSNSAAGPTILLIDDASNNTIRYCNIVGSNNTSNTSGVVVFSTTENTTGNDNNTIEYCDINAFGSAVGIYSAGTTGKENDGNTIQNNRIRDFYISSTSTTSTYGIRLSTASTNFTVSGNSLYQTSSRAYSATSAIHYGISVSNTSGYFTVTNNYIGGSDVNCGGSAYTYSSGSARFWALEISVGTTTATSVQGNTIQNFDISSGFTTGGSTLFAGMIISAGTTNVGTTTGNVIGSTSGTSITVNLTGAAAGPIITGIATTGGTPHNINNNTIAGITVIASSATAYGNLYAISLGASGAVTTVEGNTIGSSSGQINNNTGSGAVSTQYVTAGIRATAGSGTTGLTFNNNTIQYMNMPAGASNTGATLYGIQLTSTGTVYTITNNTIRNLSTGSARTSGTTSASLAGINHQGTTAPVIIRGNTIHSLSQTASSAAVVVYGIYCTGTTSGNHELSRNNIHSISLATTSTAATLEGVYVAGGVYRVFNNMIRLGIDASGNSVSGNFSISGIRKASTNAHTYVFNSIYVGGSVSSSSVNTFAFRRTSTNAADSIFNNIFVNNRSNTSGTAKHYAISSSTGTGLEDYNLFYANGTGGAVGSVDGGTTAQTTLLNYQTAFAGRNGNSAYGDPNYVNSTGDASAVDLHVQNPTPIEGQGVLASFSNITTDFDGGTRSSLTPVDIGADAGNFTLVDIFPPSISYTALLNTASTANRTLASVTITDATGVPTSGTLKPRIWYRRSAPSATGWVSNGGTLSSGSGTDGVWTFTIDYSLLSLTPAVGETYQYYIVAQDEATTPNITTNPAGGVHTNVNSQTSAPSTPNSYNILTGYSGDINVGTGETFTTLTGAGGLFAALNAGVLTGNVTALITSDITEDGTNALNELVSDGGSFTFSIKPSAATERVISGTNALALIRLYGADNVTIDGRFSGSGKYLRFRNTNTSGATFQFINDASGNTIRDCFIEGNVTGTDRGVIWFSTGVTTGNDNNTIQNCVIRDRSDVAGVPANLVFSQGYSTSVRNSDNALTNNELFNFTNDGISLSTTNSGNENWNITGNKIYQTASRTTTLTGIRLNTLGTNDLVSQNEIYELNTSGTTQGIYVDDINKVNISRNKIYNIRSTSGSTATIYGIYIFGSTNSVAQILNNQITIIPDFTNAQTIYGIREWANSTDSTYLYYNSVYIGGSGSGTSKSYAYDDNSTSTPNVVYNNAFVNVRSGGTGGHFAARHSGTSGITSTNTNNNLYIGNGPTAGNNFELSSTASSFSAWKAAFTGTGRDAYAYSINSSDVTITNLFNDPTNGDLNIKNSNAECWLVNGKGIAISGISDDFGATGVRSTTAGAATDIGADEFTPTGGGATPPAATASAAPALNTTTTYTTYGNTNASITWGNSGTVPSSVTARYYSGNKAPGTTGFPTTNMYWDISVPDGSGYTYDIVLTYDENQLGGIDETALYPAKSDNGGTTWTPYTTVGTNPGEFQRNTTNNTITLYGMTGFSLFTLGDDATPLPVELVSFTAASRGRDVQLDWQTSTEAKSSKFVVERKSDKNDTWVNVAEVQAAGNSNSPRDYSYVDKKLNSGNYSYRLKMVDIDGTFKYSDVVETTIELPKEYAISQNYPNPFNPSTRIDYQLPFDSKVMIELYSITGERVAMLSNKIEEAGYYTVEVNGSQLGLASGVYIYRIVAQNLSNGQQFMNVKKMMMVK